MKRRFRVALALRDDFTPGCDAFFLGIHQYARTNPSWQIVWHHETSQLTWAEAVNAKPDGILGVLPPGHGIHSTEEVPARVVILNNIPSPFQHVVTDGLGAGRRAASHFLEHRMEHFAYVGPLDAFFSLQRLEGFREQLGDLAPDPFPTYHAAGRLARRRTFRKWLKALPRPCGILCATDLYAMYSVSVCLAEGLAVPDDFAVLGISNSERLCYESPVVLSSVEQHLDQVGYRAAIHLDHLLRGGMPQDKPILIPAGEVIARDSTRNFGGRNPLVQRAFKIIHRDHGSPLNMSGLLQELGNVSQRLLSIHFQKALGRSPYQEILRSRILRSQRLLRTTRLSVEEIAAESGFYDCAQFCRHFRKFTNRTPTRYRGEHKAHLRSREE